MFKPDLAQANLEHASSTNSKCKPTITTMMVEPSLNNIIHLKKVATIELKLTYDKNKTKKKTATSTKLQFTTAEPNAAVTAASSLA